jgi:dissimilatory sulfite reductase (desulfoviridin) alpha/beta subunit
MLSLNEAVALSERVIGYMEQNARPKERLGILIDRVGIEEFLKAI